MPQRALTMSTSLLCQWCSCGYHPSRAKSSFVLLLLLALCTEAGSDAVRPVRSTVLKEIQLDLQDIRKHNDAMSRLLAKKAPFSQTAARALTQEARAEKFAEQRLVKVLNLADLEVRGVRNSTNITSVDLHCDKKHCSWWDRLVFEIMSNRSFVIAGLCAGVVICICGLCWEFRSKSTDGVDVELGGDDLDEARLSPISETLMELHRHASGNAAAVERLQERLDSELHRTELKLGTARLDAHGELLERTRASMATLESQEADARKELEKRLEQMEDSTKGQLRMLAQRLEVERQDGEASPRMAVGLKSLNGKVEALGEELARLIQAQTITENDVSRWKAAQERVLHLEARLQSMEKTKDHQGDELGRMEEHLRKRFQEHNTLIQSGMDKLRQSLFSA